MATAGAEACRLARYSENDSALWIACCLPFGSLESHAVGAGSRVASPPPNPFPVDSASATTRGALQRLLLARSKEAWFTRKRLLHVRVAGVK